MRVFIAMTMAALASVTAIGAPSSSAAPEDLLGAWSGTMRHGSDTGELGFLFEKRPDGRVLAREWMSNLNMYGTPIGFLQSRDGRFAVPEAGISLSLKDGNLSGGYDAAGLTVSVERTGKPFQSEPQRPVVPSESSMAWAYKAAGPIWASPIADHGVVFVGDATGLFQAIKVASGKVKWTFRANRGIFGAAALHGDALFFAADDGFLYKLNRKDGAQIWRQSIGGGDAKRTLPSMESAEWDQYGAAPVFQGDAGYVGSAAGVMQAFDPRTGKPLWQFKAGGKIRAAALATAKAIFFGSFDHIVYALDPATGKELWRFDTGSAVVTPPVLAGKNIVIGTRDRSTLFALDASNGSPSWHVYYWLSWVDSAPVLANGLLYIGSSDNRSIRAIDPVDGRVVWTSQVWGWTWGTPLVVDDVVYYATSGTGRYFISQEPSLGALDRKTGAMKWREAVPLVDGVFTNGYSNSLILANGKIIAAGLDGTLRAFRLKP